jgi:hypothetical protein
MLVGVQRRRKALWPGRSLRRGPARQKLRRLAMISPLDSGASGHIPDFARNHTMPHHIPFGEAGGERVSHAGHAPWREPTRTRQNYSTAGLIARLVILPPLLAILAGSAWLLWSAAEDALGEDSVIFLLPVLAVTVLAIFYYALPSFAGSFALLGWCGFLALVWSAVGMLVWALAGG